MGVEVKVEGLTKRFGKQTIWEDVTLTLPASEISVMLGPSGTGKSVFLKALIGLLKPDAGHIWINGQDVTAVKEKDLYEIRKLFGVLFQDGALFGSQTLYDNIAFPLREHTKKSESDIRTIVLEKMELVGLGGAERKLPGEISGGMRKRAGLARALVLDPEIILCDEPDSGLDPVRTAYLNQLLVDLNAEIEATILIVTHHIGTARTVPDNIGLLYRRHLAMFGPREDLLTSPEPVVRQFLNGRREGPIGMAEEKDAAQMAAEGDLSDAHLPPLEPQLLPSNGQPRRTQRPAKYPPGYVPGSALPEGWVPGKGWQQGYGPEADGKAAASPGMTDPAPSNELPAQQRSQRERPAATAERPRPAAGRGSVKVAAERAAAARDGAPRPRAAAAVTRQPGARPGLRSAGPARSQPANESRAARMMPPLAGDDVRPGRARER